MDVTRDEVIDYLSEVKQSVNDGRYQISPRTKNQILYIDYVFSEELCKEILYIKFNKLTNLYVIVVSFHKQDYPLNYRFK